MFAWCLSIDQVKLWGSRMNDWLTWFFSGTRRCLLTMSGPQLVPSAAGMNLVSHRCPVRWHHSDLQMSCQTNQTHQHSWDMYQPWLRGFFCLFFFYFYCSWFHYDCKLLASCFSPNSSSLTYQHLLLARTTITLVDQPPPAHWDKLFHKALVSNLITVSL